MSISFWQLEAHRNACANLFHREHPSFYEHLLHMGRRGGAGGAAPWLPLAAYHIRTPLCHVAGAGGAAPRFQLKCASKSQKIISWWEVRTSS